MILTYILSVSLFIHKLLCEDNSQEQYFPNGLVEVETRLKFCLVKLPASSLASL